VAELSGLAAVVTGGGSGIGQATARLLARRGAKVAVLDLKPGEEFTGLTADVTNDASVRLAIDTAAERLGGIDIVLAVDGGMAGLRIRPRS
jgi:2-keto-3-deoxy-L-fuconate dehydrogenase